VLYAGDGLQDTLEGYTATNALPASWSFYRRGFRNDHPSKDFVAGRISSLNIRVSMNLRAQDVQLH
jgi:hypothetical protein